jgi:hypothetical protein
MWPYEIARERKWQKIFEIFSDSVTINKGLTDNCSPARGQENPGTERNEKMRRREFLSLAATPAFSFQARAQEDCGHFEHLPHALA